MRLGNRYTRGLIFAARQYSHNASSTFSVNGSLRSRDPLPCWTWINMSERSMLLTFRWATSDRRRPVAYSTISNVRYNRLGAASISRVTSSGLRITGSFFGFFSNGRSSKSRSRRFSVFL